MYKLLVFCIFVGVIQVRSFMFGSRHRRDHNITANREDQNIDITEPSIHSDKKNFFQTPNLNDSRKINFEVHYNNGLKEIRNQTQDNGGITIIYDLGSVSSQQLQNNSQPIIINNNFYVSNGADNQPSTQVTSGPKNVKNNVIFIKPPTNKKYVSAEERTIIYVLSQESDIQNWTTPSSFDSNKPEVHFIKYNTSEDAIKLQQKIQDSYDKFGGITNISDEVMVPVQFVNESGLQEFNEISTEKLNTLNDVNITTMITADKN